MEQRQLDNLRTWFDDYVAGFYGSDEYINASIKLKDDHSRRVRDEMLYLADHLGFGPDDRRTTEVIGLLHDIGRFEQFVTYRTFNDQRSVDHCLLALEVIEKTKVLDSVENEECRLIEKAVQYHGRKKLPESLNGQYLLFSKLIRDADKLDIYYVVTSYYKQHREEPENFMLEIEFPNEPWYSAGVLEDLLAGRRIDYNDLKTWNDAKLLQLGWVYDINFTATLDRIKQRGFLQMIIDFLPQNEDIRKAKEKIFGYVDARIEQQENVR